MIHYNTVGSGDFNDIIMNVISRHRIWNWILCLSSLFLASLSKSCLACNLWLRIMKYLIKITYLKIWIGVVLSSIHIEKNIWF